MIAYITCRVETKEASNGGKGKERLGFMPTQLFFSVEGWEGPFDPGEDACLMLEGVEIDTKADPDDPTVFHARWKVIDGTEGEECEEDLRDAKALIDRISREGMRLRGIAGECGETVSSLKVLSVSFKDASSEVAVELPPEGEEVEFDDIG